MIETTDALTTRDKLGALRVRMGINRNSYSVSPGLYGINTPTEDSPVYVSANYKLSFDHLRASLTGLDGWILVLDTRGINVWCAAGKGTFGTDELTRRISETNLADVVRHRKLILPQLGAPGVAAHEVKAQTGFRVIYGPVEARDIRDFIRAGMSTTPEMREKKFPLGDRAVLTLLELRQSWKVVLPAIVISVLATWLMGKWVDVRFAVDILPSLVAGLAGAFLTPVLLPFLPFRAFSAKGAFAGAVCAVAVVPPLPQLLLGSGVMVTLSSFLAMNFTGASTYTSLSGVQKEMRVAVPLQISLAAIALGLRIVFGLVTRT